MLLTTFAAFLLLAGCEDKRRHQVSEELEFKVIPPSSGKDATPEQIGREALEAMHDLQHVRREGLGKVENKDKYESAMGRLFGVAARDRIYESVKPTRREIKLENGQKASVVDGSPFVPWDVTESAAVRKIVESWTSKIAHYVDGIDWDSLLAKKSGDKTATVTLLAENAMERSQLDAIEKEVASLKTEAGTPMERGSKEFWDAVRVRTLAQGFNVPIATQITITLAKQGDGWRVTAVAVGPMP